MHENEKFRIRDGLVRNRQRHLYVGVPLVDSSCNEVDFQLSNLSDAHAVVLGLQICVDCVLEQRAEVYGGVDVASEADTRVGEVVILATLQRTVRFHVEAVTMVEQLHLYQKLNVACERLALDGDSLRVAQAPRDASQVRRCCEVVDDVGYHLFKDGPVAYFVAQADVLVDNLANNPLSDCLHETRISDTRTNRWASRPIKALLS